MKTKIIYISGSEVFEMSDVRAAFEEVRTTLGLGDDTVLFGVPVDNDDALAAPKSCTITDNATTHTPETQEITNIIEEPDTEQLATAPQTEEPIQAPATVPDEMPATATIIEETTPVKKTRGRPRKTPILEPENNDAAIEPDSESTASETKVIPILSVLAANAAPDAEIPQVAAVSEPEPLIEEEPVAQTAHEEPEPEPEPEIIAESVTIEDMIADDAPEAPIEKTLEQLLESMTPLREDHGDATAADNNDDMAPMDISVTDFVRPDDADATLEQLAAEFADAEDKLPTHSPAQNQGKIGKLKNILPFKKARREDTGLMGDLFGWAGVAANDEDFAIPGFFTTAASKK